MKTHAYDRRAPVVWRRLVILHAIVFFVLGVLFIADRNSYKSIESRGANWYSGREYTLSDLIPSHANKGVSYVNYKGLTFKKLRGNPPYLLVISKFGREYIIFVHDSADGPRLIAIDLSAQQIAEESGRIGAFGHDIGASAVGYAEDTVDMPSPDRLILLQYEASFAAQDAIALTWMSIEEFKSKDGR